MVYEDNGRGIYITIWDIRARYTPQWDPIAWYTPWVPYYYRIRPN